MVVVTKAVGKLLSVPVAVSCEVYFCPFHQWSSMISEAL